MKRVIKFNTYIKLLFLIIGTSLFLFLLYLSLYIYTNEQEKDVYKITKEQFEGEVTSLFELNSKTHVAAILDVTYWDDLVRFTKSKDQNWFYQYVVAEFPSYEVDYIGVYGLDGNSIANTKSLKIKSNNFIPKGLIAKLNKSKLTRTYLQIPEGVIEVFGGTIHPSNDPKKVKSQPSGYFFTARLLDSNFFGNLEKISSASVSLSPSNNLNEINCDFVVISKELKDWKNSVIAKLDFKRPFNLDFRSTKNILFIIIIASLINILIYLFYFRMWIFKPLKKITTILESGDEHVIIDLKKAKGEFGYIGNLFEENNHQRKQLEISKQKAEESDKLKSSFLANLSHEIRTPMNAIVGFTDLLKNKDLNETDKNEYLEIITNSGNNLVSIIEDLIEMSKIDAKQISPKFTGIDINKFIAELYETINITIPQDKDIDFYIVECKNPLAKRILSDEIKLKQIVTNLITNAIKYTESGFVAFGYNINEEQRTLEFTIQDSGIGICEDNYKIIFDRFRRIEDDFSVELSGLGLGLAISKAYVEILGGSITVSSEVGVGSVFSFIIPLKFDEKAIFTTSKKLFVIPANTRNEIILVVEDDNINFLLLKKILQIKNHTVLRASNGQEAIDICIYNNDINLVFMDIKMPVLDGYQAFEIIKKIKPSLPVIAQTAHSSSEEREKIEQAGFTDYITKPIDKEKIFELLDSIFRSV